MSLAVYICLAELITIRLAAHGGKNLWGMARVAGRSRWRGPAPALAGYLVMVSVSSVTAAVRASARPWMVTPVVTVIEARAMMFPLRVE